MVFAELACVGSTDSNTVCALCGMTVADLPFVSDYFDVIMKVGRPWKAGRDSAARVSDWPFGVADSSRPLSGRKAPRGDPPVLHA